MLKLYRSEYDKYVEIEIKLRDGLSEKSIDMLRDDSTWVNVSEGDVNKLIDREIKW